MVGVSESGIDAPKVWKPHFLDSIRRQSLVLEIMQEAKTPTSRRTASILINDFINEKKKWLAYQEALLAAPALSIRIHSTVAGKRLATNVSYGNKVASYYFCLFLFILVLGLFRHFFLMKWPTASF